MTWLDAVEDGRGVLAVYGGEAPSLSGIDVQAVRLHHTGPTVNLYFSLRDFPATPPAKWVAKGFDIADVTLSFFGASDVRLTGWDVDVVGDLELTRVPDGVAVAFRSPASTFTLTALAVYVQNISGSQRLPDDAPW